MTNKNNENKSDKYLQPLVVSSSMLAGDGFSRICLFCFSVPVFLVSICGLILMLRGRPPFAGNDHSLTMKLLMEFLFATLMLSGLAICWAIARPRWVEWLFQRVVGKIILAFVLLFAAVALLLSRSP